ncbi:MAG: biopolymer transporter ExbD [Planctomycetota bacterium]|jgi:biopolymer transport protein ExbD|nr:biopolymer transporter ExbD [Planctomycetota bacterium]
MKFTARKRSSSVIINLTPLIDCMFLLIIFIMIAARFEPDAGIAVDLPMAGASRQNERARPERITVTVDVDGTVYLGQDTIGSMDDLERRIADARANAANPSTLVLEIYGDRVSQYGRIVEVMDAAQRAKQQQILIRTKQ